MTNAFESFPEHTPTVESLTEPRSAHLPQQTVTLQLPQELMQAIDQRMQQSGQTQMQIILEVLQGGLAQAPYTPLEASDSSLQTVEASQTAEEFEQLKQRVAILEALLPRMEVLEGKSIAF